MKYVSALALLAALSICVPAYAQSVKATTSTSPSVTVSAGGTSASAGGSTNASASAGSNGSSTSASASAGGSGDASAGASAASSAAASGSGEGCSNGGRLQTTAIDSAALASVTTVDVELVPDCSGLAQLDSSASAALAANSRVAAALQAAGGSDVLGYDLDGTTLTVFAKKKN